VLPKGLNVTDIYVGASISDQARSLKRGTQFIVYNPGDINDMINVTWLIFYLIHQNKKTLHFGKVFLFYES